MTNKIEIKPKKKWYKKWKNYFLIGIGLFILMIIIPITTKGQPAFANIKSPIYQSSITIAGYNVEPNAKLDIILNGKKVKSVNADKEGYFSILLDLIEGENTFKVSTLTSEGKIKTSSIKKIVYIIKAPNLKVSEPLTNSEVENPKITIKGKTDENGDIEIQGNKIKADENGNFEIIINLSVGKNQIKIIADNGKKKTEKIIKVNLLSEKEIADKKAKKEVEIQKEIEKKKQEERKQEEEKKIKEKQTQEKQALIEKNKKQEEEKQAREKLAQEKLAEKKQALIEKRKNFNSGKGNNYEAASTAQGFISIFKAGIPNVEIDMYIKLTAYNEDERAYENGGDLTQYRNKVYATQLLVVIDGLAWSGTTDNGKKNLVAGFVNGLHILYPNASTVSVAINNGIRMVAEGNWSFWNGEAEVKLK